MNNMKIYIMTDIEGVCGVVNFDDWALPQGRYYEEGKKLLTMEVNAAIEGFFAAGATEILVADGHGLGAINNILLDHRVSFLRGPVPGPYPFMLDETFDAIAWVGQHAKAGTECAHMAHTGSLNVIDYKINGISVGEFGQIALCRVLWGKVYIRLRR
jgi:D-amino peptidase